MYHSIFVCSSVYGHLGCFRVLAIVNSAAVNMGALIYFCIMVFSGYMPGSVMCFHRFSLSLSLVCALWLFQRELERDVENFGPHKTLGRTWSDS